MIQRLEVNIRENLHDLGVGNISKQDTTSTNQKSDKSDYIKIRKSFSS